MIKLCLMLLLSTLIDLTIASIFSRGKDFNNLNESIIQHARSLLNAPIEQRVFDILTRKAKPYRHLNNLILRQQTDFAHFAYGLRRGEIKYCYVGKLLPFQGRLNPLTGGSIVFDKLDAIATSHCLFILKHVISWELITELRANGQLDIPWSRLKSLDLLQYETVSSHMIIPQFKSFPPVIRLKLTISEYRQTHEKELIKHLCKNGLKHVQVYRFGNITESALISLAEDLARNCKLESFRVHFADNTNIENLHVIRFNYISNYYHYFEMIRKYFPCTLNIGLRPGIVVYRPEDMNYLPMIQCRNSNLSPFSLLCTVR